MVRWTRFIIWALIIPVIIMVGEGMCIKRLLFHEKHKYILLVSNNPLELISMTSSKFSRFRWYFETQWVIRKNKLLFSLSLLWKTNTTTNTLLSSEQYLDGQYLLRQCLYFLVNQMGHCARKEFPLVFHLFRHSIESFCCGGRSTKGDSNANNGHKNYSSHSFFFYFTLEGSTLVWAC